MSSLIAAVPRETEILIDTQTLVGQTVYTGPTWTANRYRSLRVEVDVLAGNTGGSIAISLTGLSGTKSCAVIYASASVGPNRGGDAASWTTGFGEAPFTTEIKIKTETNGGRRFYSFIGFGNAASSVCIHGAGDDTDTTHDVTNLVLTLTASANFKVKVWGVPT